MSFMIYQGIRPTDCYSSSLENLTSAAKGPPPPLASIRLPATSTVCTCLTGSWRGTQTVDMNCTTTAAGLLPNVYTFPSTAHICSILIANEKWKSKPVIFTKWAWGTWDGTVQIRSLGQHTVSQWNWPSSFQTWGKPIPVPSAMLIPVSPQSQEGNTSHCAPFIHLICSDCH